MSHLPRLSPPATIPHAYPHASKPERGSGQPGVSPALGRVSPRRKTTKGAQSSCVQPAASQRVLGKSGRRRQGQAAAHSPKMSSQPCLPRSHPQGELQPGAISRSHRCVLRAGKQPKTVGPAHIIARGLNGPPGPRAHGHGCAGGS